MAPRLLALQLLWIVAVLCAKTKIDKVHVIFSNHLDVGYHRGLDIFSCAWNEACTLHTVMNQYWHHHIPFAIDVSNRLQREFPNAHVNRSLTSNYMTFPWLLSLYLDCDPNNRMGLQCPSKDAREYVLNGIRNGHVWFNAFPFNSQVIFHFATHITIYPIYI